MRTSLLLVFATLLGGCNGDGARGGSPANRIGDSDGQLGVWSIRAHPCAENRTDTLWVDDASTAFVGCGSGVNGTGMFRTTDGGLTWDIPVSAGNTLSSMRVNSISRGPDGLLYVAGTGGNGVRVVTFDGSTTEAYYQAPSSGAQPWQTFQVGSFRVDSNDRAVSESLTGTDVIYWPNGEDDGVNGEGWWAGEVVGNGAQILALDVHDDRFYGSGSTINQPPYFFYEPAGGMGNTFAFEAIDLSPGGLGAFTGEAWDLDMDDDGSAIVSGVNQGSNTGVVWWSDTPTSAASWSFFDVSPLIHGSTALATRFYGACREGDVLVAVGDYSQREEALVLISLDRGANWNLYGPPGNGADTVGPLSKCQLIDGQLYVAGAGGFFGILDTTVL